MSNVVPLFDDIRQLFCGCTNATYYVQGDTPDKLVLVCTACEYEIENYKVTKDESVNG